MEKNDAMYAQLVLLLDIYERNKKDSAVKYDYIYNSGAVDALKKLKEKYDKLYEKEDSL